MKKTLSFDQNAGQFRCDIGKPSKRFYLGSDADAAQERKLKLNEFWNRCQMFGQSEWDADSLAIAKQIGKGEAVQMKRINGEGDDA
jgi:hypothetical protein